MSATPRLAAMATIVVPTVGRTSLGTLLESLADFAGTVLLVDDRPGCPDGELPTTSARPRVLKGGGRGPAHARNVGWRHARTPWVVFLDDDVLPGPGWLAALERDLTFASASWAGGRRIDGVQGRLRVPDSGGRRSDGEWTTRSLEDAPWVTADMAYRREALSVCGGFDERFTRAFREDADLAIRIQAHGGTLIVGERKSEHPARREPWWACLKHQRGNADDMLMRSLHGPGWRHKAASPQGLRRYHVAAALSWGGALAFRLAGRRRLALASGVVGSALIGGIAARRIRDSGVRGREILPVVATSALLPFLATAWTAWGVAKHRHSQAWRGLPDVVLFDRDGTLIHDVPYNGDPTLVQASPGSAQALRDLRVEGVQVGIVTNQSGVARGLITREQVQSVNGRVEELLGPFDVVSVCAHGPWEGCDCRKPSPGQVSAAVVATRAAPNRCVVIGDSLTDMLAATNAGAFGILVPSASTPAHEAQRAPVVEPDMVRAVARILDGRW